MRTVFATLRAWSPRRWLLAGGVAAVALVVTGLPTDLIPNPVFGRSVPIESWAYPVWILSSLLLGVLVAAELGAGKRAAGGGLLAVFAVGCPVCNKPVLLLLGTSGALTWFAPIQPVLGALAVVVPAVFLWRRLRVPAACALAPRSDRPAVGAPGPQG